MQKAMSICERSVPNYKLASNVAGLYIDAETADVNFIFDSDGVSEYVPAHKCILAAASPVFKRMFYGELKEGSEIRIVDVCADGFKAFLQYFYLDAVTYNNSSIADVMKLADKYCVTGCMQLCQRYLALIISTNNVCFCYELALLFDLADLIGACEERICAETQKVLESSAFLNCSRHILGRILLMDDLSCDEVHVFQASMHWAMEACKRAGIDVNNADNLKQQLGSCFESIRFPAMSADDFYTCIADKENLFTSTEIMDILSHLTLHRPLQVATRFEQTARKGIPIWTKDETIRICDRRSSPNLCRQVAYQQDIVIFSVNERILLGQIAISTFKPIHDGGGAGVVRTGQMTIRRMNETIEADPDSPDQLDDGDELVLEQSVNISSGCSNKIELNKPIIIQPFHLYEIESKWNLEESDELVFRTECREIVMLDGGIRFQFKRKPNLDYDNVTDGLVSRLYFKQW